MITISTKFISRGSFSCLCHICGVLSNVNRLPFNLQLLQVAVSRQSTAQHLHRSTPLPEQCCKSGCINCIYIVYADELCDFYLNSFLPPHGTTSLLFSFYTFLCPTINFKLTCVKHILCRCRPAAHTRVGRRCGTAHARDPRHGDRGVADAVGPVAPSGRPGAARVPRDGARLVDRAPPALRH